LLTLPNNLYQTRRRLKTDTLAALVVAATGLPRMLEARADAYLAKAGEMLAWAARKGFLPHNPAAGAVERKKKTVREQDARHEFSRENLHLIFSAPWFATGKGERSAAGKFRRFQPYHFWLPLLGLFTGGRLNELAQLHLADIQQTPAGVWFLNFSTSSENANEPAKRLKTVNSIRQVPLHPELVRLGLPEYVQALADAGYDRLFPELRFDSVKGYGKAAGQWFDEKFLGNCLDIPRDGMQTFHSFRHNFISALTRLDPPLNEFVMNQLSGHERGETMSRNRYTKDQGPDALNAQVSKLNFSIPTIDRFDVAEGLQAVLDALGRRLKPATT
jgi:integrase